MALRVGPPRPKWRRTRARAAAPCRVRKSASRTYRRIASSARRSIADAALCPPTSVRPGASRSRTSATRILIQHLGDPAHVERHHRPSERHGLEHRARERIGVHARNDRHVEVRHERAHVRPEAQHVEDAAQPELARQRSAFGHVIRRKSSGVSPTHHERDARALGRIHAVDHPPRRLYQLGCSLPCGAGSRSVAADDDGASRGSSELLAQARRHEGRIEGRDTSSALWITVTLSAQCGKSVAAAFETHTMRRTPGLADRRSCRPTTAPGIDVYPHVPERRDARHPRERAPREVGVRPVAVDEISTARGGPDPRAAPSHVWP